MSGVSLSDVLVDCRCCAELQRQLQAVWDAVQRSDVLSIFARVKEGDHRTEPVHPGIVLEMEILCPLCANTRSELTEAGKQIAEVLVRRKALPPLSELHPTVARVVYRWCQAGTDEEPF